MSSASYLQTLPASARRRGDHTSGEIEILPGQGDGDTGAVYEDKYVVVIRDPVRFPSGSRGTYLRIFERAALDDGVAGVAVIPYYDGHVWMRSVFRHATRSWETEIPRGFKEPGEGIDASARRELSEELGADAAELRSLGSIYANSGLLAGRIEIVWTALSAPPRMTPGERTEAFGELIKASQSDLRGLIERGEIRDGITLAALLLAQSHGLLSLTAAGK